MTEKRDWVNEDDFIKLFGLSDDHCSSCHSDSDDGYYDGQMCCVEWDNKWSDVCCTVKNAYDEKMKEQRKDGR